MSGVVHARHDTSPYDSMRYFLTCPPLPTPPLPSLLSPTLPYPTISYHTIPYHTIPYHTIPYHTIPYHTIPYHTILLRTLLYHTSTAPYNTVPTYHNSNSYNCSTIIFILGRRINTASATISLMTFLLLLSTPGCWL